MLFEVVCAGFGGQGILFLGDILAEAALREGLFVTFLPTYGVAMRGGTANCTVTISDQEIGSPILDEPNAGVLLNQPSVEKFQHAVRPGGLIVGNSTITDPKTFTRDGEVRLLWVPATEMAKQVAGTDRAANMVSLGAFLALEPVVKTETIEALIREVAFASKPALIEKNLAALHAGMEHALRA